MPHMHLYIPHIYSICRIYRYLIDMKCTTYHICTTYAMIYNTVYASITHIFRTFWRVWSQRSGKHSHIMCYHASMASLNPDNWRAGETMSHMCTYWDKRPLLRVISRCACTCWRGPTKHYMQCTSYKPRRKRKLDRRVALTTRRTSTWVCTAGTYTWYVPHIVVLYKYNYTICTYCKYKYYTICTVLVGGHWEQQVRTFGMPSHCDSQLCERQHQQAIRSRKNTSGRVDPYAQLVNLDERYTYI